VADTVQLVLEDFSCTLGYTYTSDLAGVKNASVTGPDRAMAKRAEDVDTM